VTDGEILLIEAANNIPKWLNPETADNRVSQTIIYNPCINLGTVQAAVKYPPHRDISHHKSAIRHTMAQNALYRHKARFIAPF
jgi:hypothetical protein